MNLIILFSLMAMFALPVHGSPCDQCNSTMMQPSKVEKYCQEKAWNLTSNHRCCFNSTLDNITDTDILGIDLSNCSLQNVTGLFKDTTSVVIISLEENPLTLIREEDFYKLTHLDYLYLPGNIDSCPGGSQAWTTSTHGNTTLECETQINTCENKENNETCPTPQSYCAAAGPGLVDCLCSPDYHGYKCLRKGTFPLIPFVGGVCGSTLVTAAFLWITQRRFVEKHSA